ncbi:hypothetical protein CLIM01_13647 [Colletotrichum limetticola]|uniref:Uncharacterized protein n=1 Tax=Colletotrichum limetticola TaxID=1209924 RepID=A0ABQ9PBT8_9PEZI|nr:hypothetical protein CLIM01_13647 [Colletotrichum limetticola]
MLVLERAASLVQNGVAANELEFHDSSDDAVAVLVYATIDAKGERIYNEGIVLFADEDLDAVITGEHAEATGIWLYPVPQGGLYVDNACVEYIRKKKPQEGQDI